MRLASGLTLPGTIRSMQLLKMSLMVRAFLPDSPDRILKAYSVRSGTRKFGSHLSMVMLGDT